VVGPHGLLAQAALQILYHQLLLTELDATVLKPFLVAQNLRLPLISLTGKGAQLVLADLGSAILSVKAALASGELDGMRVCHLGDLGQSALRDEQIAAIGKPDVLMVPVGGHFTIDAEAAAEVVRVLDPAIVVPMHYGSPAVGLPLAPVDDFLALMEGQELRREDAAEFDLARPAEGTTTVVVPAAP